MPTTRVLIAVKTYPTLSEKYDELVCTAGFLEDGTWIRIYPIPFRKLSYDKRYSKWQWIELDLVKNTSDFRKESFRPANIDNEISDYPFMHLLYSQLLVCQRVCLQNTVCLICK